MEPIYEAEIMKNSTIFVQLSVIIFKHNEGMNSNIFPVSFQVIDVNFQPASATKLFFYFNLTLSSFLPLQNLNVFCISCLTVFNRRCICLLLLLYQSTTNTIASSNTYSFSMGLKFRDLKWVNKVVLALETQGEDPFLCLFWWTEGACILGQYPTFLPATQRHRLSLSGSHSTAFSDSDLPISLL